MAIVNSRPLTVDNIHDPESLEPLTPNHLLTMKSRVILPPPGNFQRTNLYAKNRWRRVQHLANQFWTRLEKGIYSDITSLLQMVVTSKKYSCWRCRSHQG